MILVDANLLLYAKFSDFPQHGPAAEWLQQVLSERSRVGLPWHSLLAFIRIGTSARVFSRPLPMADALEQVNEWLGLPGVWVPAPTDQHATVLGKLLLEANAAGNLVSDAHLAALSLEHGLEICSADADYARFPGVRWHNPLTGATAGVRERSARYRARRISGRTRS